jgi:lipopolysaccharide export LptBFGC system permease protein LptF
MKPPGHTLLLLSGILKLGGLLLILLMFVSFGWDWANGRQAAIPPVLLVAIPVTLAAQLAAWLGWRYVTRGETGDDGA